MEMQKVNSNFEAISCFVPVVKGKTIIDVGCGIGEFVRELTGAGAFAIGVDKPELLEKAFEIPRVGNETYIPAQGERLPFEDDYADVIVYFASLHHIPGEKIRSALIEARRVLKKGGILIIVEPVAKRGAYFEITKLVEDEREIQRFAYREIKKAPGFGLEMKSESFIYFERSYENYIALLNIYVPDDTQRNECLNNAKKTTERYSRKAKVDFNDFRYKSICRINVLEKV